MRTFAEFHDSRVRTISILGDEIIIEFPFVYLYLFEGAPFQEPGSGCGQIGRMVFSGVISSEIPHLQAEDETDDFDVWSGSIGVNGQSLNGVFELPLKVEASEVKAQIEFNSGAIFKVSCTGVSYFALSEPSFIEPYRA